MITLTHDHCTGCSACFNICPKNAIRMTPDVTGAIYPMVDNKMCIRCRGCITHCPEESNTNIILNEPKQVFAAVDKDRGLVKESASGGLASILAEIIVRTGGVYYGCEMRSIYDIAYQRIETLSDVKLLRGSKYVHANIHTTYQHVRKDLLNSKTVLFIGTPCLVAGLKAYLRNDYNNLYTIDLVCHGTPPQKVLTDYASTIISLSDDTSYKVDFRWKKPNSMTDKIIYGLRFYDDAKTIYRESFPKSPYITAFFNGYIFRENCYNCRYASIKRVGDITLGDFWELGTRIETKLNLDYGVSMVMVNTEKGKSLFSSCHNDCEIEPHTIAEAILSNTNLRHATYRPKKKDEFKEIVLDEGLKAAVIRLIPEYKRNTSIIMRTKVKIAKVLRKLLR